MGANENGERRLPNSESCFVCGRSNHAGLKTRFYEEDGCVKARLNAAEHHCGYPNVVHGGVVAALVDECMGWAAARAVQRMCYTAELKVRYLRPVPSDRETVVSTEVVRSGRRLAEVKGRVTDSEGATYVRAEGRFIPLSAEETLKVDEMLLYDSGERSVFESLRRQRQEEG